MNLSVSRVVAIATPVFAAAAGAGTAWLSKHFPGLPAINPAEVTVAFGLGASAAAGAALKWLNGHAQWEQQAAKFEAGAQTIAAYVQHADPGAAKTMEALATAAAKAAVEAVAPTAWPAVEAVAAQVGAAAAAPAVA